MPTVSKAPFYLVSSSPRRLELLQKLGISPQVTPAGGEEFLDPSLSPEELTLSLAQEKMDSFLNERSQTLEENSLALSADTLVHIEGQHLGKPKDRKEAKAMLTLLSGKEHRVSTGFVLKMASQYIKEVVTSTVTFHALNPFDIDIYLKWGEWHDAAGAYKIQEGGEILINNLNGSHSNVMGLPISHIYAILRANNFWS